MAIAQSDISSPIGVDPNPTGNNPQQSPQKKAASLKQRLLSLRRQKKQQQEQQKQDSKGEEKKSGLKEKLSSRLFNKKLLSKLGHAVRLFYTFIIFVCAILIIPFLTFGVVFVLGYWQLSLSLGRLDSKPFPRILFDTIFFPINIVEDLRVLLYGKTYSDNKKKKDDDNNDNKDEAKEKKQKK